MKQLNKQLRDELLTYSSKEIVKKSGMYASIISMWRHGEDLKTISSLNRLAGVLGKKIHLDGISEDIELRMLSTLLFEMQNYSTYNLSLMTGFHANTFFNMRLGKVPHLTTMLIIADRLGVDFYFEIK